MVVLMPRNIFTTAMTRELPIIPTMMMTQNVTIFTTSSVLFERGGNPVGAVKFVVELLLNGPLISLLAFLF